MLDVFTMMEELDTVDGLTVVLVGDLKHGRTVHSLVRLLALYKVKLHFVAPDLLQMPEDIVKELEAKSIPQASSNALTPELVASADVLYVTRVQKERFADLAEYDRVKDSFVITAQTMESAKDKMVVMHPLPRVGEIAVEVDSDPRAAYFRQMACGMYMRMAIIAKTLDLDMEG